MTHRLLSRSSATAALLFLAGISLSLTPADAETARSWTDTKGRSVSAVFVRQDADTVWIKRADGREVSIVKNTLSDADQIYLASLPAGPPAAAGAGGKPAPAAPSAGAGDFATAKVDPASFKPIAGGFSLDSITLNNSYQSEHFIVAATEKVKAPVILAYLDAAERLWSDLLKDVPSFAQGFDGGKFLIALADGDEEAKILDSWHSRYASTASQGSSYLRHYDMTRGNIISFKLEKDFAAKRGVAPTARMYRTDTKGADNLKRVWPQRIHFLCEDLIRQAQGGSQTLDNEDYNLALFDLCFSYQREFSICGKIETEVHYSTTGADVEGFKNGKGWAVATKKLIKNGMKPDIEAFLKVEVPEAAPRDLGIGYGLVQWMRKDPKLRPGLDKLFADALEKHRTPDPKQFAETLGFDSPDALNAAWLKYLESDAFQ